MKIPLYLLILICLVVIISCGKTDLELHSPLNNVLIDKIVTSNSETSETIQTTIFTYTDGILNDVSIVGNPNETKSFRYSAAGDLVDIEYIDAQDNLLYERDSIVYNEQGVVVEIYKLTLYPDTILKPRYYYSYVYDNDVVLQSIETFSSSNNDRIGLRTFEWIDGNISKMSYADGGNTLLHEWHYTYDDNYNYKLNNGYFIEDPLARCNNNVVKFTVEDYTGLLDLICFECDYDYTYEDGRPVKVILPYGQEEEIIY